MPGICQILRVLVVVMVTIDQGMSWEELQNGPSNQDDDLLGGFPISVRDDNAEDDAVVRHSDINLQKENDDRVVVMKASKKYPDVKDESTDQGHPEVSHDAMNEHNNKVKAESKTDKLPEADVDTKGNMRTNVDTVDGNVDVSPDTMNADPKLKGDNILDEDRDIDPLTIGERSGHVASNGDLDAPQDIGQSQTKVDRLLDLSQIEVYGDDTALGKEIDCTDGRFMDNIDCLLSTPADANLSKEGLKARQQLFDFMELKREKRQAQTDNGDSTLFDEGSGTGDIYPETIPVTNGTYILDWNISFNVTTIDDNTKENLETQLGQVFSSVNGFQQVNVTSLEIVNGTLVAKYQIVISGRSISEYGLSEQEILDNLQVILTNVTLPLYKEITIEGERPLNPFNASIFTNAVGELLLDICSSLNPCPDDFTRCNATGLDEGVCLHLCYIFELEGECEHGGTCELNENNTAFCSCTDNWSGDRCQDAVTSNELDRGEIIGATLGALLVVIGIIGCCCWFMVCRKGTRNIHMTHYSDDASGSDRFSNPSSKISTFVIDRPRISTSPFNAFNPGHSTSPYQTTVRAKPTLFSDA